MLLAAASSRLEPLARQALVLQSIDRGNLTVDYFTSTSASTWTSRSGARQFPSSQCGSFGIRRRAGRGHRRFHPSRLRGSSQAGPGRGGRGPRVRLRTQTPIALFPDTPLLFAAVDRESGQRAAGRERVAAAVAQRLSAIIDDILQLLPRTKQVFMVMGSGRMAGSGAESSRSEFQRFRRPPDLRLVDDLSLPESCAVARAATRLSDLFVTFGTDLSGAAYADERVLAGLLPPRTPPCLVRLSVYMGHGAVGGRMMPVDEIVRTAVDAAVRLLNGAPRKHHVPPQLPGRPIFDWRELRRWGIPESRCRPAAACATGVRASGGIQAAVLGRWAC